MLAEHRRGDNAHRWLHGGGTPRRATRCCGGARCAVAERGTGVAPDQHLQGFWPHRAFTGDAPGVHRMYTACGRQVKGALRGGVEPFVDSQQLRGTLRAFRAKMRANPKLAREA